MAEFWLDQLKGARAGVVDHFDLDTVRVGRNDEGELVLDETGVSWDHAELRLREGAYWLIDHGSTNGTYVNDERAHNALLKDGDVLRFGKRGPVMRFRLEAPKVAESSGERPKAPPPKPVGRRRAPSEAEIAVPILAEERNPSQRHSDLPPAASLLPPKRDHYAILSLVLGLLATASLLLLLFFYVEYSTQGIELEDARKQLGEANTKISDQRKRHKPALEEALAKGREQGREQAGQDLRSLERSKRTLKKALAKKEALLAAREKTIVELQQKLAAAKREGGGSSGSAAARWREIERRVSPSVLLIAVELRGKKKDGTIVRLDGFGTGFFASDSGHVVTNKHVVQPWKFRDMALRIAKEEIEVDHSSYKIHAWRSSSRFLRRQGKKVVLDPSTGYSTTSGTLELVRTAPDTWHDFQPDPSKSPMRAIRIHTSRGNGDIAILRAKANNVVALRAATSTPQKLHEVLVVGYPAGPAMLQAGRVETSPAPGYIRKVNDGPGTIDVSAPIVPGNSGGPLIDSKGRVIGVCTTILKDSSMGSCLKIRYAMRLIHGGSW